VEYSGWALTYAAFAVFAAGFIKGYSGFAFSALLVLSLSILFPPALIVPPTLILETLASLWLLPRALDKAHWTSLRLLCLGLALGTPLGVAILAQVPARPMRAIIAAVALIIVILLKRGFSLKKVPGAMGSTGIGLFSGVLNGAAAIGGMPVSVFYFSSPLPAAASRASMIVFLFFANLWTTGMAAWQGLVSLQTLTAAGFLLLPMLAGVVWGRKAYKAASEARFRATVLNIVLFLSLAGLIRAYW
jgi:uncharacterized membrane protein YfcA